MPYILVVEDDPNNALVFEAILRRIGGFDVGVTEDVDEIIESCRSGKVDLVIMDVSLTQSFFNGEKVDGLDIAKLLKEDDECKNIPVLLATAHAMKGDKERFLTMSGADGYITKPVMDHRGFVDTVKALILESENHPEIDKTV